MGNVKVPNWLLHLGLVAGSVVFAIGVSEVGLRVANIPPQPGSQAEPETVEEAKPTQPYAAIATEPETAQEPNPTQPQSAIATEPETVVEGPSPDEPTPNFFRIDENLGWALEPNVSGWWQAEGVAYVEINSDGLRDREYPKEKPDDTIRIAILGDSFAEALQVDADETFWAIMERNLANCPSLKGRKVEAINFGVTNYGTAQQLLMLRQKVWDYDPDIVLLAVFTGNDIADNSRELDNRNRPYFVYQDGELVADMSFRTPDKTIPPYGLSRIEDMFPDWLTRHSRILQLAKKVELGNRNRQLEEHRQYIYSKLYREPDDPAWINAWNVTEGLMTLMHKEVTEKGSDFMVVTLTNEVQVNPNREFRRGFRGENNIEGDLFYPDRRIKALGDRVGFPVLNLVQDMQAYAQENQVCLHGFDNALLCGGHWNAEGHRLAGQLIAPAVCPLLESRE